MTDRNLPTAAVIGAGPAGLMAAETLARGGAGVTVYEHMPSPARKFLMAGRGGLNLTHSEPFEGFIQRFLPYAPQLRSAIEAFGPSDLRAWCAELGQETFIGSSGRVFPRAMKASPLLRAWLRRLDSLGAELRTRHRWSGWDAHGRMVFETPNGPLSAGADTVILAFGGASWPNLGSDGMWTDRLIETGVAVAPLRPSNCGFLVNWSEPFRERFPGTPLKGVGLRSAAKTIRSEIMITRNGVEGTGMYALSPALREAVVGQGEAVLTIDLCPGLALQDLTQRLAQTRGKQSLSTYLRKTAKLPPVAISLLHETTGQGETPLATMTPDALAARIKAVPIRIHGIAPIARAISTAGGVSFDSIDAKFMLKSWPGIFAAGEMLDWEAPTGGYLLQGAFSTGLAAGHGALDWLRTLPET